MSSGKPAIISFSVIITSSCGIYVVLCQDNRCDYKTKKRFGIWWKCDRSKFLSRKFIQRSSMYSLVQAAEYYWEVRLPRIYWFQREFWIRRAKQLNRFFIADLFNALYNYIYLSGFELTSKVISIWIARSSQPGMFCKKVFLEISQNSQENTCTRVSFLIKLQAWGLQLS